MREAALASWLLGSAAAALLTTLVLLVRHPSRRDVAPPSRAVAFAASLPVLAAGPVVVALLHGTTTAVLVAAVTLLVADAAWLPLTRSWSWRGHAAWAATTSLSAAYLAYALDVSLAPGRGAVAVVGALVLWLVELVTFALGAAFLWEAVDALARTRWQRRSVAGLEGEPSSYPFVSLHVPAHNEPPEMVIETVRSLLAQDYPSYEVVVVDNNTTDPALWEPVRDYCAAHDVTFLHLEDWPGFKSGALNEALRSATDPRADVIGVVDADYVVDPDYLRRCAPLFADRPDLAFVQTPQNYREWEQAPYFRRLFYSYEYFFRVSQPVRNEVDGAIFGGTMGLIRRSALEDVGGWDEWCITEDAEVSLKLLRAGWSGQHVERAFGHGIMPLTYEALKRQRFRWCFGGVQILKAHWRSLLPWDRSPSNHLTQAQRWAYLSGGLQWFADLLGLAFVGFLLLGAADLLLGHGLVLRRLSGLVLGLPVVLLLLGVTRAVAVLRARSGAGVREAVGALGLWLSLGITVSIACVRALVEPAGVFLRTPKTKDQPSLVDAVRANRVESVAGAGVGAVGVACASVGRPTAVALGALLGWHALGLLAAPANSLAALRADLPARLRRRRATEVLRDWVPTRVRPVPAAVALLGTAAAAVVGAVLLAPATAPGGASHDVLGQVRGRPHAVLPLPSATAGASPSAAPTRAVLIQAARRRATATTAPAATTPAASAAPAPSPTATRPSATTAPGRPTTAPSSASSTRATSHPTPGPHATGKP